MRELELLAPAKVNLFLGVLGRRDDGYHDIVSVMQKLDFADQLHLRLTDQGITLHCPESSLPTGEENLAWKAAQFFFHHTGISAGVRITLRKRIFVAAGLGGGSSDAAAVLCGLNQLCGLPLSESDLLSLGGKLGADVPFFIADQPVALVTGTGTELWPISGPRNYCLLLINPGLAVSTAWVYSNLRLTTGDISYRLRGYSHWAEHAATVLEGMATPGLGPGLYNDLEPVTISRHPEIHTIKERLLEVGATASLMSGSGPTVFGVFPDAGLAAKALAVFQGVYPESYLVHPLH